MTVSELIEHLKTLPPELPVAMDLWSEQIIVNIEDVTVKQLGETRADGWVPNARPDKPTTGYVVFSS